MKISPTVLATLVYCVASVVATPKGGDHEGGGHDHGSNDKSASNLNNGTTSHAKGAHGSYDDGAPSDSYSKTRNTFKNLPPANGKAYSPATHSGFYGNYNSAQSMFLIAGVNEYPGYTEKYHRYNAATGYYYAANLTYSGSDSSHVTFNGTANGGGDNNFLTVFDISANNQSVMVDHAYFASSDPNVIDADFVYRTKFSEIIEYDDTNQNGMYDKGELIYTITSLKALDWQVLKVTNNSVFNNTMQFYYQTSTTATVNYNNTSPDSQNLTSPISFNVSITFRETDFQLNDTAYIPIQPNSLEYDFGILGFPTNISTTYPNARLAVITELSSTHNTPFVFDVNATTSANATALAKENATYGISIGQYIEGRLEFQNNVNISGFKESAGNHWGTHNRHHGLGAGSNANNSCGNFTNHHGFEAGSNASTSLENHTGHHDHGAALNSSTSLANHTGHHDHGAALNSNASQWIWGNHSDSTKKNEIMVYVTLPGYKGAVGGTINTGFSMLAYLDVDVMNAIASGSVKTTLTKITLAISVLTAFAFAQWI